MKIKKLIEALRNINGRRLAKAIGIELAIAFIVTTIFVLGKYAPGVLVAIGFCLLTALVYFFIQMSEK